MRPVVGRVHDDRVVGEAELVEQAQQVADEVVVVASSCRGSRTATDRPGPCSRACTWVRKCMCVELNHTKNGCVGAAPCPVMKSIAAAQELVVDGLHALLGERAGVLDPLRAVGVGPRVDDPAGPEALLEVREVLGLGVVVELGLLFGVEVVEVAEELVEAVRGGQELVPVAQVVLAELAGRVALRLQRGGDGRVLGTQADVGARACPPWSGPCGSGSDHR